MPAILFVCTANVCRSPMAEAIFKHLLSQRSDAAQWKVASAGTWGMNGSAAAYRSQVALKNMGLKADLHVARTVTREMLDAFDLVLTMEKGHQEALRVEFPQLAGRIFLLSEMVGQRFDIQDPIGGTQADFHQTAQELTQLLSQSMEQILQIAAKIHAQRTSAETGGVADYVI